MERAAKAAKTLPAPTPARARVRPHPATPATAAAALQSRIGASGARKMLAGHAHPAHAKRPAGQGHHDQPGERPGHDAKHGQDARKKHGQIGGDGKDKAPALVDAGGPEGGAPEQAAEAKVKLHIPEPPSRPSKATMGRIAGVKARAGGAATAQGTLPDAASQVGDAQKAVAPPSAERLAEARAALIAQVHAAPSPAIVKLCERIRQVIRDKRPPDEDALAEADPEKTATEAGGELNATVQSESKKVEDNYQSLNTPGTAPPAPPAPPLTPQPAAAQTPPLDAKSATPDAVPAGNVSLDKDAEASRKRAEAAGMNKPAAALVQSGPVAETRAAQGELDDLAKADPAKVLAEQKEALSKANADMGALQMRALAALTGDRAGTAGQATEHKKGMVGTEAQMREKAGADAKAAFDEAQALVKDLLKDLVPNAMAKWDTAKAGLTTQFKADLKIVQDRVDDRHSGASGFVVGLWDAVTGLPDWATEAYDKAENNFADGVIAKLTEISTEVDAIIKACEALIKKARDKIAEIFNALPTSLKEWAAGEQTKFNGQLDKLGKEVHDTQESFNKDLAGRASQAVDEVRAEISELRKKAGGLVGRIVAAVGRFLDDPVKFIIEGLLEILGISPPAFWAVIAKIKKVASDIVDDPMGFANNLMAGIGQGFSQFFDNFGTHMVRGFLSWLLGDLKGVQIPKDFSPRSIITFFLQIMGITWPNIRKIIAKKVGEKNVALIEKVWSLVSVLIDKGPEGIFDMIKEKLDPQAIVDQVIQMAVDYMVTAIAKQVAIRIALLFNPAGAILQAIEAIYRVLKWVFQNAARIFTLIETIVNGLADIIAGNVGGFANAVEKGLEMLIAPVLGFIADYFSLGDLPKTVAKQIKGFQGWILGMIEAAFDWVIEKGKALLAAVGIGGKKEKKGGESDIGDVGEDVHFTAGGEQHRLWIEMHGGEGVLMVASTKQSLDKFFASKKVTEALKKDTGKLAEDIGKAQKMTTTADRDIDELTKEVRAVREAKAAAGGASPNLAMQNNKVKEDQRSLAEILVDIFDALQFPEPVAGLHTVERKSGPKAHGQEESHHVPPKGFIKALRNTLLTAKDRVKLGVWKNDPNAMAVSGAINEKIKTIDSITDVTGKDLSAVLISEAAHREPGGAHSSDNAEALAAMTSGPSAILAPLKSATRKIGLADNAVSVNAQEGGWQGFLGEVHIWNQNRSHTTTTTAGRIDYDTVELIIAQAQLACQNASQKDLQDKVITPFNNLLMNSPQKAYDFGVSQVMLAMSNHEEGTPSGRRQALSDLIGFFASSYGQVRVALSISF